MSNKEPVDPVKVLRRLAYQEALRQGLLRNGRLKTKEIFGERRRKRTKGKRSYRDFLEDADA